MHSSAPPTPPGDIPLSAALKLARDHLDAGRLDHSVTWCRRILQAAPNTATAWAILGIAAAKANEFRVAVLHLNRAVELAPQRGDLHFNLGCALAAAGESARAETELHAALELDPGFSAARFQLGNLLIKQERSAEARLCLERLVADHPTHGAGWYLLGRLHFDHCAPQAALPCFAAATEHAPQVAAHWNYLGLANGELGNATTALEHLHHAVELEPENWSIRANLGLELLRQGELPSGWREYETRRQLPGHPRPAGSSQWWEGTTLGDDSLLLYAEQGFGDTLQLLRYLPLVRERFPTATLRLAIPRRLQTLVEPLLPEWGVTWLGDDLTHLPPCDWHFPLWRLPLWFGTTLATIPATVPYLKPAPDRLEYWKQRLATVTTPGELKVGLVMSGKGSLVRDCHRSIPPELWQPLLELPGIRWFNLQRREPPAPAAPPPLVDWMEEMEEFAATAALVAQLDLVIGVDTAVIHLAGALGRPTWLLNRLNTDWRWLRTGEESPWYPTMRLYRQDTIGEWQPVIARVKRELERLTTRE